MMVFLFKQKTTYDMHISDWSSDVCSSDLDRGALGRAGTAEQTLPDHLAFAVHLGEEQVLVAIAAVEAQIPCGGADDIGESVAIDGDGVRACLREHDRRRLDKPGDRRWGWRLCHGKFGGVAIDAVEAQQRALDKQGARIVEAQIGRAHV